jgi:hypothetical protein
VPPRGLTRELHDDRDLGDHEPQPERRFEAPLGEAAEVRLAGEGSGLERARQE